jgi:hypothetical protein
MLPTDDAGSRQVRERAFKLADTGNYENWRMIEAALIGEGWPNSHAALEKDFVRLSLDARCAEAKATRH